MSGLPPEGLGVKTFWWYVPRNEGKPNILAGYAGIFAGYPRDAEKFENKRFVFNLLAPKLIPATSGGTGLEESISELKLIIPLGQKNTTYITKFAGDFIDVNTMQYITSWQMQEFIWCNSSGLAGPEL